MKEITIGKNEAGQRLDKFLGKYMKEAPKGFLYKMLRKKNIVLNGKKAEGKEKLEAGDRVRLFLSDETIASFSQKPLTQQTILPAGEKRTKLAIIYEDDHVLFLNKPAGMLSQKAGKDDISAVEEIIAYLLETKALSPEDLRTFRPSVCNRLDRNTSGILAAGKSLAGLQELSALFKDRTLWKYYRCICVGQVQKASHIKGYLVKNEQTNTVRIIAEKTEDDKDVVPIETAYAPVAVSENLTLLEVHLITGRTHQIRAHLASQGHPILGDYKYGNRKANERLKKEYGVGFQLLHAYRIEFPERKGVLSYLSGKSFTAAEPDYFQDICREKGLM